MQEERSIPLPNKLSDLIEVALRDLELVEADPRYEVRMPLWHTGATENVGTCLVCLAGAVMAKSGGASPRDRLLPGDYTAGTAAKLCALDIVRCGEVRAALQELGIWDEYEGDYSLDREVPPYGIDRDGFKAKLRQIAADLRAQGL